MDDSLRPTDLHPAYFETRFRVWDRHGWPNSFAIVSAWTTTGEEWPEARAVAADHRLGQEVKRLPGFVRRLIGYCPVTGHSEPSWAVATDLVRARETGGRYRQDAVYWVKNGRLFVTRATEGARLVAVGRFIERLDDPIPADARWGPQ